MAKSNSRKQWIKALVLTVGVADCVGIYMINQRLTAPVPDEVRFDTAYTMPIDVGTFRPEQGAAPVLAIGPAAVAAKPAVADAAAAKNSRPAVALAPAAAAPAAVSVARSNDVRAPVVAAAPRAVSPAPERLRLANVKVAAVAVPAGTVTTRLKAAKPAVLAVKAAPPEARSVRVVTRTAKVMRTNKATLSRLVPAERDETVFASAFAGLDNPVAADQQLEQLQGPADPALAEAQGDVDFAQAFVAPAAADNAAPEAPVSELPAMAPAQELPASL